jgi:hypothetical protein
MLRTSLIALAATCSLAGFANNQASAQTVIRIDTGYPPPVVYQPAPVIYEPPPVVVVTNPPPVVVTTVRPYAVYYRECPTGPWRLHACYSGHRYAHDAIIAFRARGFEAYIGARR